MSPETVNFSDSEVSQIPEEALELTAPVEIQAENLDDEEVELEKSPKPRRKFSWWMIPVLGAVLAVGGLSVYRLQSKNTEVATVAKRAPLSVKTVAAKAGNIQAWVSSEGTVQAVRFKHLAFDVDGDITYLANKDGRSLRAGDSVKQGELLAQIDDRKLQADVIQAESAVNEVRRQRGAKSLDIVRVSSDFMDVKGRSLMERYHPNT